MRFSTIEVVYKKALNNKNFYFITGDLNHVYEKEFNKNIKDRYINGGLAEQNIIGMAAGLALSGKKVVVYSIVPFITMRCFEQIKVDLCYQNLDVVIIGIGGGFAYGKYGNTHCSIEDIGVMKILPNMRVVCPANPMEAGQLMKQVLKTKGPTYFRIGRGKELSPDETYRVKLGKIQTIRPGNDVTIFTTGTILDEGLKAAKILQSHGVSTEVINVHTVKPLDKTGIIKILQSKRGAVTVEEHNIINGLGSSVSEIIAEELNKKIFFKRFGVHDKYLKVIGSESYLRKKHGFSANQIASCILKNLNK